MQYQGKVFRTLKNISTFTTRHPQLLLYIIFFNLSQQRQIIMNFGFSVNYKVQVALADGFPVCISLYNVFPYFPSIAIIFLVDPLSTKRKLQPWQHKLVIMTYRMVAGFLYEYILCYMRISSLRIGIIGTKSDLERYFKNYIFSRWDTHTHRKYRTSNTPFWGKIY